jgi:hypothetical protein
VPQGEGHHSVAGSAVVQAHGAATAKAVGPDPTRLRARGRKHGLRHARELSGQGGCGQVEALREVLEEPASEEREAVHRDAQGVQALGELRHGVRPGADRFRPGPGLRAQRGPEPVAQGAQGRRVQVHEPLQPRAGVAQEAGGPRALGWEGHCLPHKLPVRLRAEDGDFDYAREEQRVAELTLLQVVVAQRAVVQRRHVGGGGTARPLAPGRQASAGPGRPAGALRGRQ